MTNRDLYLAVTARRSVSDGSDRSLECYLLALWQECLPLAGTPALSGETFLRLLDVAFTAEAPPFPDAWRTLSLDEESPGFSGFEATLMLQVVDLREMVENDVPHDGGGTNSPRGHRWYNFDPDGYLECAVAGMYSGWDPDDDTDTREIASVTWEDFRDFLSYGQSYE